MFGWENQMLGRDWWKSRDKTGSNFCPERMEVSFLHVLDPNSSSFYVKCPRKCQKTYNFDIFLHFPKFTPLPLLNFGMNLKFDDIHLCAYYQSYIMQSLMFPNCFVQKLSKKKLWGVGSSLPPPGKGRANSQILGFSLVYKFLRILFTLCSIFE